MSAAKTIGIIILGMFSAIFCVSGFMSAATVNFASGVVIMGLGAAGVIYSLILADKNHKNANKDTCDSNDDDFFEDSTVQHSNMHKSSKSGWKVSNKLLITILIVVLVVLAVCCIGIIANLNNNTENEKASNPVYTTMDGNWEISLKNSMYDLKLNINNNKFSWMLTVKNEKIIETIIGDDEDFDLEVGGKIENKGTLKKNGDGTYEAITTEVNIYSKNGDILINSEFTPEDYEDIGTIRYDVSRDILYFSSSGDTMQMKRRSVAS